MWPPPDGGKHKAPNSTESKMEEQGEPSDSDTFNAEEFNQLDRKIMDDSGRDAVSLSELERWELLLSRATDIDFDENEKRLVLLNSALKKKLASENEGKVFEAIVDGICGIDATRAFSLAPGTSKFLEKFQIDINNVKTAGSGGNVLTFIPGDKDCVVQLFGFNDECGNALSFQLQFEQQCREQGSPEVMLHICRLLPEGVGGDVPALAFQKCLPINKMENRKQFVIENGDRIWKEISATVIALNEMGLSQGDCTIDNIGVKDGKFVLFDFNLSKRLKQEEKAERLDRDLRSLQKSIEFNKTSDF